MNLAHYLLVPASFLLGSIPWGYVIARAKGVDIRKVGSGNIGATNVMRSQGKALGILVLLLDAGKGLVPVLAARWLAPDAPLPALAAAAAVFGHCYSFFMKGKGGKGVATSLGAFLALCPYATLAALVLFLAAVAMTRYVSVGSILAALTMPLWTAVFGYGIVATFATLAVGLLITHRHTDNIKRLVKGQENRIGSKARRAPTP